MKEALKAAVAKAAPVAKAVVAGALTGATGAGTMAIVPADVPMPWYGYVVAALVPGILAALGVYATPNKQAG